jgi:hypothetical protein
MGVGAPLGLMGVVALPRVFVFRVSLEDPHPIPWIRVKLSCAMGDALYPDPQWRRLSSIWEEYYPLVGLDPARRELFAVLEAMMPTFIDVILTHRPLALRGTSLGRALLRPERSASRLRACFDGWRLSPGRMLRAPPALVFAATSQARADGKLSPHEEGHLLSTLLTRWAVQSAHSNTPIFAEQDSARGIALAT